MAQHARLSAAAGGVAEATNAVEAAQDRMVGRVTAARAARRAAAAEPSSSS